MNETARSQGLFRKLLQVFNQTKRKGALMISTHTCSKVHTHTLRARFSNFHCIQEAPERLPFSTTNLAICLTRNSKPNAGHQLRSLYFLQESTLRPINRHQKKESFSRLREKLFFYRIFFFMSFLWHGCVCVCRIACVLNVCMTCGCSLIFFFNYRETSNTGEGLNENESTSLLTATSGEEKIRCDSSC